MAAAHPDLIDAAVGVHPHHAAAMDEAGWARLEGLAAEPSTRAIGEIGLDFFRNLSPPDVQREALARQLGHRGRARAAGGRPRPRGAHRGHRHAPRLVRGGSRTGGGFLHAFSGDRAMAEALVEAGFVISFALPVSVQERDRGRARLQPCSRSGSFTVETDSPYLGPDRDANNEPTTTLRVVAELARLRGEAHEEVAIAAADGVPQRSLSAREGPTACSVGTVVASACCRRDTSSPDPRE